jgi:hypothetical protein
MFSLWKLHGRGELVCRTCDALGEADVLREETGVCTGGTPRGRGPGAYARITEIMSGRALAQQGLAATCKDLWHEGHQRPQEGKGLAHEPVRSMKEG